MVTLLLSLLLGIQPIALDLFLPALPAVTQDLQATMPQAQLTMSVMVLAFGVSQLFWGPLSDRFGRRPVLLCGTAAFAVASTGVMWAEDIGTLTLWRAVQGVAVGAAVVGVRAIVRDLFSATEAATAMSRASTGVGLLSCVSVPLGGWLVDTFHWRASIALMVLFGCALFLLVWLRFQESLAQPDPRALQPGRLFLAVRTVLRHPTFCTYVLLSITAYCGLFTFMVISPFVLVQQQGLSKTQYGLVMVSLAVLYIVGTVLCRLLLRHIGLRRTVAVGASLSLLGGLLLAALHWAGIATTWAIVLPIYLVMMAHGIHQPCGQSGAVSPFPAMAGTAAAFSGFLMTASAFFVGQWAGRQLAAQGVDAAQVLSQGVLFWSLLINAVAWLLVPRFGELRPAPVRTSPNNTP